MRVSKVWLARTACGLALSAWGCLSAAGPGVTNSEIVIGQSGVLSGPLAPLARELQEGARLYVDRVNSTGGVHGRLIKIVSMDDAAVMLDVQAKHCTTFQFKTQLDPAQSPQGLFSVQNMRGAQ